MTTAIEQFQGISLIDQAKMLAGSNLVPKAFRGKPADILVATLWGAEVGLGPIASMNFIDVIDGTPTMNAEGGSALIRRAGHSLTIVGTSERCEVKGKRRDSGDEMTVVWTIEDAKRAKLATKDNWSKYPRAMLRSRAVSEIARALFSDVFMGITYSPEEVESFSAPQYKTTALQRASGITDPEFEADQIAIEAAAPPVPIDTATGEILDAEVVHDHTPEMTMREGQQAQRRTFAPPSQSAANQKEIMRNFAAADKVDALKARIKGLPDDVTEQLKGDWTAIGLPAIAGSGRKLTDEQFEQAEALVAAAETMTVETSVA